MKNVVKCNPPDGISGARRPEVQAELERLSGTIDDLSGSIHSLIERLTPVMNAPSDGPSPTPKEKDSYPIPMVETIEAHRVRLGDLRDAVQGAINRLEI